MRKVHRKPAGVCHSGAVQSAGMPAMKLFETSSPKRHYVNILMGMHDEWWSVSAEELSERNIKYTYSKALEYFGVFVEGGLL